MLYYGLFSHDLHILDLRWRSPLCSLLFVDITPVCTTFCGYYPCVHYFYVPWLIMKSINVVPEIAKMIKIQVTFLQIWILCFDMGFFLACKNISGHFFLYTASLGGLWQNIFIPQANSTSPICASYLCQAVLSVSTPFPKWHSLPFPDFMSHISYQFCMKLFEIFLLTENISKYWKWEDMVF